MSDRPPLTMRYALAALGLSVVAGCSSDFHVDAFPTAPGTSVNCGAVAADLPFEVAGEALRRTNGDRSGAWGDPAIVLRCGVEKPAALTPASRCDMVGNVGWFTETTADGLLFTTVGREFYISVEVPSAYDPEADALVDLVGTVEKHDPLDRPCV